jgi:hypothetical protein
MNRWAKELLSSTPKESVRKAKLLVKAEEGIPEGIHEARLRQRPEFCMWPFHREGLLKSARDSATTARASVRVRPIRQLFLDPKMAVHQ